MATPTDSEMRPVGPSGWASWVAVSAEWRSRWVRGMQRMPAGLAGMLVLVVLVEGYVARHRMDFLDPTSLSWQLAADAARERAPACDLLCVGDSLVKHSLIPKMLEAETGRAACNLAVARGPVPATYFLLRKAIDAGAKPSAIVLDVKPSVLVGSPTYNLRYWQQILSARECFELARDDRHFSLFVEIMLGRMLPTFRSRNEVRGAIMAALRGEDPPMRRINRILERNWRVNDGANVAAKNPSFTGAVDASQHKKLLTHLWYYHKVNKLYLNRILELTEKRGITVYWLLPPLAPETQARREQSGAETGYLKLVKESQARFPHLRIVDARHSGYQADVFVDATHLDGEGANTVSVDFAALLNREAGGKGVRWSDLPAFQRKPRRGLSEDVAQSRQTVGETRIR